MDFLQSWILHVESFDVFDDFQHNKRSRSSSPFTPREHIARVSPLCGVEVTKLDRKIAGSTPVVVEFFSLLLFFYHLNPFLFTFLSVFSIYRKLKTLYYKIHSWPWSSRVRHLSWSVGHGLLFFLSLKKFSCPWVLLGQRLGLLYSFSLEFRFPFLSGDK